MSPKDTNWYVLYTFPRAEKQVKERIDKEGVTCWLPLHRSPRVWSDRVKLVDVPLFNSYIFVYCTETVLRSLIRIYGVVRIVYTMVNPP
nr:UpxY family transcription antiterminator [uncultured Macellibacteroides sp.]